MADFPQEAMAMRQAGWTGERCSALHVPTQRAAMTDAVRCDGRCTAMRHLPENTIEWRTAYKGCLCIHIPQPVKAACGRPCKALIQVWNRPAPLAVRHCGCGCGRPRG